MKKVFLFILISFLMSSCVSMKKRVYIQEDLSSKSTVHQIQNKEYEISQQDILYVTVKTLDDNSWVAGDNQQVANAGEMLFYLKGYSVNNQGAIVLPIVGHVEVLGKTLSQIKDEIQLKVASYYKDAIVEIRTAGVKINVLGEVRNPGLYTFYQNEVSIFDALSISGDLTDIANRTKVRILRHHNDTVSMHYIDLTNDDLLGSEFYLLQPNDVIYAEPLKAKTWGIGQTGWQTLQTLLTTISSTFLIISYFNN